MSELSAIAESDHALTSLASLAGLPHWVTWHNERRSSGETLTKVPYGMAGRHAKSSDPNTWLVLDVALAMAGESRRIGVMLGPIQCIEGEGNQGLSLIGIDFDTCVADGVMSDWALACFTAAGTTYWEYSPSATGVKAFYWAHERDLGEIRDALGIGLGHTIEWKKEGSGKIHPPSLAVSLSNRFFTVTGTRVALSSPLSFMSPSQALALRAACDREIGPRGAVGRCVRKSIEGVVVNGGGGLGEVAVDPLALACIVAQIPNDARFDERGAWIGFAHALHNAFVDQPALGKELWEAFCDQREQVPGEVAHAWASTGGPGSRAGAQTILGIARDCGIEVSDYEDAVMASHLAAVPVPLLAEPDTALVSGQGAVVSGQTEVEVREESGIEGVVVEPVGPVEVEIEGAPVQARPVTKRRAIHIQHPHTGAVKQALRAIGESGVDVFQYGGGFVWPVRTLLKSFDGPPALHVTFEQLDPFGASYVLGDSIDWFRWDARSKGWVPTDPTDRIVRMWLACARQPVADVIPQVIGAISTPTLRLDGSYLTEPGFDPATQLYMSPDPNLRMPPGWDKERPTYQDAMDGMDLLDGLLHEFPFASDVDRSIALSALMVPLLRGLVAPRPMHAFDAPMAATGKTYLVTLATSLALGRQAPVATAGQSEEELEKRLGALLIKGLPVVVIDNVNGELGGRLLCTATDQPSVEVRILGLSKTHEITGPGCIFATGNNLIILDDMVRRTLVCKQDAKVERPETREFKDDPLKRLLADRGRFVAAALTAVRAHMLAGCPGAAGLVPMASYKPYTRHVRGTLCWLGRADPAGMQWRTKEDDPAAADLLDFVKAWVLLYGYEEKTLSQAVEQLGASTDVPLPQSVFLKPEIRRAEAVSTFREVATRISRGRGVIDMFNLGQWMKRNKDKIARDHRFVHGRKNRTGVQCWKIERNEARLSVVEEQS